MRGLQKSRDIGRVCFLSVAWIPHYIFEIVGFLLFGIAAGLGYVASLFPRKGIAGLVAIVLLWLATPFGIASEWLSKLAYLIWSPQRFLQAFNRRTKT